jgi:hypothetical protein
MSTAKKESTKMQKFDVSVTFDESYGETFTVEAASADDAQQTVHEQLNKRFGYPVDVTFTVLEALTPEQEEELELYYDTRADVTHEGYLRMYGAEDRESVLINLSSKTI